MTEDGSGPARLADTEQAETYLRLLAEAELRGAVKQRPLRRSVWHRLERPLRRLRRVRGLRVLYRRVSRRARVVRIARLRPERPGFGGWLGARRRYRPSARFVAAHSLGGHRHPPNPTTNAGLRRLAVAAGTLAAAGAVETATADAIVDSYRLALVMRRRLEDWPFETGWSGPPHRPAAGQPARPLTAISIGRHVPLALEERTAEVNLLSLVIDNDRAVLTFTAKPPPALDDDQPADEPAEDPEDDDDDYQPTEFLFEATVTDDQGIDYDAAYYTNDADGDEDDDELWTSQLELTPAPATSARWLDLTLWPGTPPVRVALDAPPAPPELTAEHLPAGLRAEQCLSALAETMLQMRRLSPEAEHVTLSALPIVTGALTGAGVMAPDSPALCQLASLGRRLDFALPASVADLADTELPPAWRSVLDDAGAADGPTGLIPAAAVLPDLDGTSWALAGLRSTSKSMQLRMFGWSLAGADRRGQIDRSAHGLRETPAVWARDDTGRWHYGAGSESSQSDDQTDLAIELVPPLHPAATSVDIIVTGTSERVTVTVPLTWLAASGLAPGGPAPGGEATP
jgi:hypothetical protein